MLADTAVVGRLGTPQLGGLAVASTILLTGYAVFVFLAYGTTASVSRLVGAGQPDRAAHQAVQSMWLAVGLGLVVTALGLALAPALVDLMGASDTVRPHALVYLRISLVGVPALLVTLAGTGYLRGLQDTRTTLVVAVVSVAGNLALQLVLIYGFDFGIGASALSTVIAQMGAAAAYVRKIAADVRSRDIGVRPELAAIRRVAVVGRDLFFRTLALRLALTVATAVAARLGTVELASHQIAFEIWSFLALVLDALAIAGQALVGRLLGAERPDDARQAGRRLVEWGAAAGCLLAVVVAVASPALPRLFTDDAAVVRLAAFLLLAVAVLQPVNGVVFVLDGVLIGAGDMAFLAKAMVVAALVFVPAALVVVALDLGIGWLWVAIGLLMGARVVMLGSRFAGDRWLVTGSAR
ncbi:MAG: DNA-damage-inducible protein F [uncultured Acidimicrobiales bacterium]|uniref:DNA-damage-inducible protein F n=1 Tax=uncultured Acidimicrobiales bacterium TaxID=310071 RepID=A0A6J4ISQ9_9ACTN|nr:MAG: DNA-damage-inducible protein F [uncultured Acidimicrobiales bacterium]